MELPTVISLNKTGHDLQKGKKLFVLGRYHEALREFEKALQIHPNDGDLWVWQAATLTHLDDFTGALMSLERALKEVLWRSDSEYDLQSIYLFRGIVLRELARHRSADASFHRALKFQ